MNDETSGPDASGSDAGGPVASGLLERAARGIGGLAAVERLAALSGSHFTSVLLEVVRRRAARQTPPARG